MGQSNRSRYTTERAAAKRADRARQSLDELVWSLKEGDQLQSLCDQHLDDDPAEARVFMRGKAYKIVDVRPLRCPACVIVVDDQGHQNHIEGELIRQCFSVVRTATQPQQVAA